MARTSYLAYAHPGNRIFKLRLNALQGTKKKKDLVPNLDPLQGTCLKPRRTASKHKKLKYHDECPARETLDRHSNAHKT
jgi:hypothetical protein